MGGKCLIIGHDDTYSRIRARNIPSPVDELPSGIGDSSNTYVATLIESDRTTITETVDGA